MFFLALLSTYWFWGLIVCFAVMFYFVVEDNGLGAFLALLAFGAASWFLPDIDAFYDWVVVNKNFLFWLAVVYFPIGLGWSIFKWWVYAHDQKDLLEEKLPEWKKKFKDQVKSDQDHVQKCRDEPTKYDQRNLQAAIFRVENASWEKYYAEKLDCFNFPPEIAKHKASFIRWLSYWPFSVIHFVCKDFFRRIGKAIYDACARHLQAISDHVFKDMKLPVGED